MKKILSIIILSLSFYACTKIEIEPDCGCIKTTHSVYQVSPMIRAEYTLISVEEIECSEEVSREFVSTIKKVTIFYSIKCK